MCQFAASIVQNGFFLSIEWDFIATFAV